MAYHETECWRRYLALLRDYPAAFRPHAGLEILTDEETVDRYYERTRIPLGVVYESPYNRMVVDLVREETTDDGGAPVLFESVHDNRHEEVCGFGGCEVVGEVAFDVGFFVPAVGRIHEYDVELVFGCVVENVVSEGVPVKDLRDV